MPFLENRDVNFLFTFSAKALQAVVLGDSLDMSRIDNFEDIISAEGVREQVFLSTTEANSLVNFTYSTAVGQADPGGKSPKGSSLFSTITLVDKNKVFQKYFDSMMKFTPNIGNKFFIYFMWGYGLDLKKWSSAHSGFIKSFSYNMLEGNKVVSLSIVPSLMDSEAIRKPLVAEVFLKDVVFDADERKGGFSNFKAKAVDTGLKPSDVVEEIVKEAGRKTFTQFETLSPQVSFEVKFPKETALKSLDTLFSDQKWETEGGKWLALANALGLEYRTYSYFDIILTDSDGVSITNKNAAFNPGGSLWVKGRVVTPDKKNEAVKLLAPLTKKETDLRRARAKSVKEYLRKSNRAASKYIPAGHGRMSVGGSIKNLIVAKRPPEIQSPPQFSKGEVDSRSMVYKVEAGEFGRDRFMHLIQTINSLIGGSGFDVYMDDTGLTPTLKIYEEPEYLTDPSVSLREARRSSTTGNKIIHSYPNIINTDLGNDNINLIYNDPESIVLDFNISVNNIEFFRPLQKFSLDSFVDEGGTSKYISISDYVGFSNAFNKLLAENQKAAPYVIETESFRKYALALHRIWLPVQHNMVSKIEWAKIKNYYQKVRAEIIRDLFDSERRFLALEVTILGVPELDTTKELVGRSRKVNFVVRDPEDRTGKIIKWMSGVYIITSFSHEITLGEGKGAGGYVTKLDLFKAKFIDETFLSNYEVSE